MPGLKPTKGSPWFWRICFVHCTAGKLPARLPSGLDRRLHWCGGTGRKRTEKRGEAARARAQRRSAARFGAARAAAAAAEKQGGDRERSRKGRGGWACACACMSLHGVPRRRRPTGGGGGAAKRCIRLGRPAALTRRKVCPAGVDWREGWARPGRASSPGLPPALGSPGATASPQPAAGRGRRQGGPPAAA